MGARRLSDLFSFADVFASRYGAEASGGEAELVTLSLRDAGEEDGQDDDDVEVWSMAPVLYRPAAPDDKGKCQVVTTDVGGQKMALASRDLRAATAAGALNEGDAAFCCPSSKVALRCNADNSIALMQQGESADAFITIQPDGTIVMGNAYGQLEIGPNGVQMFAADGTSMTLGGGAFHVLASQAFVQAGVVGMGPTGGKVPLTFAPTSGIAMPFPNFLLG